MGLPKSRKLQRQNAVVPQSVCAYIVNNLQCTGNNIYAANAMNIANAINSANAMNIANAINIANNICEVMI